MKGSLLAAAAGVLSACGVGAQTGGSGSGSTGRDTLVEAAAAMPVALTYDLGRGAGYEAFEAQQLLHANMIRNPWIEDPDNPNVLVQDWYNWEGELAEGFEVSPDGLIYTFHLRQGVVSQAGNPLTADDVIWSYERKFSSAGPNPALNLPALTDPARQFVKVDDHTVQIHLAAEGHGFPLLAVISKFTGFIYDSVVCKENATPDDPFAVDWSNIAGNFGYGPYIMDSYEDGVQILYSANPKYALGEPALKSIVQRIVPEAANRAALVRAGDVDVAVQLLPADVADMRQDANLQTFDLPTNQFTWLIFQCNNEPFDNELVRQALRKAIPYEQIIDTVYHGAGLPAKGWMDPNAPGYNGDGIIDHVYDPEGAKALLDEAGVQTPVAFSIMCNTAVPDLQEVAVQIQSFASDAGFAVSVDTVPSGTDADRKNSRNFQVVLMRDMVISWESQAYTLRLLRGESADDPGNWAGWGPPEYYQLIEEGVAAGDAFSDAANAKWHEAHLMWQDGCSIIQLVNVTPLMVYRTNVAPYTQRSDNIVELSLLSKTDPVGESPGVVGIR